MLNASKTLLRQWRAYSKVTFLLVVTQFFMPQHALGGQVQPPKAFDLIPDDAAFSIGVRNIKALHDRGDKFLKANNIQLAAEMRPSQLLRNVFEFLGVTHGVDENGPAAVILPNLKTVGLDQRKSLDLAYLFAALGQMVYIVPVENVNIAAGNYTTDSRKVDAADLNDGNIQQTDQDSNIELGKILIAAKGKLLYVSHSRKALAAVLSGKPLAVALSAAQRESFANADLALHFGPRYGGLLWPKALESLKEGLNQRDNSAADNEVVRQFLDAAGEVKFIVAGLRLDDSPALDLVASFPDASSGGAKATKFLTTLAAGPGASDLVGLPKVEPLLAYAAKGDGVRNVAMARTLVKVILNNALDIHVLVKDDDRKKFYADFDAMYQHLKGSRLVIYRLPADQTEALGRLAAVGILDIDDPEAHLAGWSGLVDFANTIGVKLIKGERKSSPRFTYKSKVGTIDGLRVDRLGIEIPDLPDSAEKEYREFLGPDWNTVRLVDADKRIVFLVGSDIARLRESLVNLKSGAKGLAAQKTVAAALTRLAPERKLEVHANLLDWMAFRADAKPQAAAGLNSWALIVEPQRLQMQVRINSEDVKAMVRGSGLSR